MARKGRTDATRSLADRAAEPLDLLVIGGGIVGAGVALAAVRRGLRPVLVEQGDFASGTSGRSSRLLHGGLRYLAQGRLGLVHEASVEKMRLHRLAPHLCEPLPFVFPVWRGSGWSRWQLAVGVRVYDWLCGGRNLGRSSSLDRAAVLRQVPGLRSEGLVGASRHFDALTNDARLVLDSLRTAEAAGASLHNYATLVDARPAADGWVATVADARTGRTVSLRTPVLVNAAGAWADRLPASGLHLRLTKGVHAVVDRARLPVPEAVILPDGDRILFVIPWGERVILGTTDTDYVGDPAAVRTEPADVASILDVVNAAFPQARLDAATDVLATWAGVRPLIAPRSARAGAPSDISRRHVIRMSAPGWFDVAGGKLTTYRRMGQETIRAIERHRGRSWRLATSPELPIQPGLYSGIVPPPVERAVVLEAIRHEWAVHLEDVLVRRTSWHYYHRDAATGLAETVADWMAEELGWDHDRRQAERERYLGAVDPPLHPVAAAVGA